MDEASRLKDKDGISLPDAIAEYGIAEADLALRGPGDILGTAQSGLFDLRFADFITDTELIREARALADRVFDEDPELSGNHSELSLLITENKSHHHTD